MYEFTDTTVKPDDKSTDNEYITIDKIKYKVIKAIPTYYCSDANYQDARSFMENLYGKEYEYNENDDYKCNWWISTPSGTYWIHAYTDKDSYHESVGYYTEKIANFDVVNLNSSFNCLNYISIYVRNSRLEVKSLVSKGEEIRLTKVFFKTTFYADPFEIFEDIDGDGIEEKVNCIYYYENYYKPDYVVCYR